MILLVNDSSASDLMAVIMYVCVEK